MPEIAFPPAFFSSFGGMTANGAKILLLACCCQEGGPGSFSILSYPSAGSQNGALVAGGASRVRLHGEGRAAGGAANAGRLAAIFFGDPLESGR